MLHIFRPVFRLAAAVTLWRLHKPCYDPGASLSQIVIPSHTQSLQFNSLPQTAHCTQACKPTQFFFLSFTSIPFFFLLQASLRLCPSSSSVMVKSAGIAVRLPPFLSLHLPCKHPPPPPRPLLSGIACPVANP